VPRKVEIIAGLIAESRDLEELGRRVQGERELIASDKEIDELVERCQAWFGRALAVVPEEFRDRLRAEYNGSWHSSKIKQFLQAPGEVSLFGGDNEDGTPSPLPYWQHPYDTTFHGPLLALRQILVEAQQQLQGAGHGEDIELVERLCRGFAEFLVPLSNRQRDRPPIVMEDEYDVQDLLHGLLRIFFDDVRPEDFTPERAGARSRIDFVLKQPRIVVEAKMTRAGRAAARVGEELIVDIERYRSHPDCDSLVALVYDPERLITNRRSLERDLSGERDGPVIRVIWCSRWAVERKLPSTLNARGTQVR
jgi:REase_DpnII-MboI